MLPIRQKRFRVAAATQVLAIMALHVYWAPTQIALAHQMSQPLHSMAVLQIVPHGYLAPRFLRKPYQFLRFDRSEGKGFLHIDMAAPLQGLPSEIKMSLRR